MTLKRLIICFILLTIILGIGSCFIGAGTHGAIHSWEFNASKDSIEKIINLFVVDNRKTDPITMITCKDSIYFVANDMEPDYFDVCLANATDFKVYKYRFMWDSITWKRNKMYSVIMLVSVEKGTESMLSSRECDIAKENFEKHFISHIARRLIEGNKLGIKN